MTDIHTASYNNRLSLYNVLRRLILSFESQTFIANIVILFLQLVTSILLARWLGPEGRGKLAAALLWPTVLIYLGNLGLIDSVAYYSARTAWSDSPLYVTTVGIAALQGLILIPVAALVLPFLLASQEVEVVRASQVYLLVIPIALIAHYGFSVLQGNMVLGAFNVLRNSRPAGYLAGTLLLHLLDQLTIINIVFLQIGLNIFSVVGTFAVLRWRKIPLGTQFSISTAKMLLRYGLKIHVGRLSSLMNERLDQLLLAAFVPPLQLGLYVAAVSTSMIIQPLAQAINTVLVPRVAQDHDAAQHSKQIKASFQNYWLISLAIIPFSALALPFAIPLVFGSGYHGAILPAEILLIASLLAGARVILAGGAMAMGNAWLGSVAEVVSVAVTAAALAVLLPPYGIVGAALATLLAYGTSLIVTAYGMQRHHAIRSADLFRIEWSTMRNRLARVRSLFRPAQPPSRS